MARHLPHHENKPPATQQPAPTVRGQTTHSSTTNSPAYGSRAGIAREDGEDGEEDRGDSPEADRRNGPEANREEGEEDRQWGARNDTECWKLSKLSHRRIHVLLEKALPCLRFNVSNLGLRFVDTPDEQ